MSLCGPWSYFNNQKTTYHARVHGAGLIAGTYHPGGDGLHVEVGLTLLQ